MENLVLNLKNQPITLLCSVYIAKGFDIDSVIDVAYNALRQKLNLADELKKAFIK